MKYFVIFVSPNREHRKLITFLVLNLRGSVYFANWKILWWNEAKANKDSEDLYKSGHESQGILDFVHIALIEWTVPDNCKDRFRGCLLHTYFTTVTTTSQRALILNTVLEPSITKLSEFCTSPLIDSVLSAKLSAEVSRGFECWVTWNSTSLRSCFTSSFPASPNELFDFPRETVIASYKFKSILIPWIRLTDKRRVGASKTEIIKNRLSWNYNLKYHQYSVSILSN